MICTNCNNEWSVPDGEALGNCPACGEDTLLILNRLLGNPTVENILQNILLVNGREILKDKQRLSAMINDLFQNDKQTMRLLRLSIQEEVPLKLSELYQLKSPDLQIEISALKTQVKENTFCEEEALNKMFQIWPIVLNPPVENILQNLLLVNGREILKDKQRLSAMINDLFHNDTHAKRLLRISIQEELPLKLSELYQLKSPDLSIKISTLKAQVKDSTFCEDEALNKMFQYWATALYPPKKISTKVEPEDGEWIDELGVSYSADHRKLIKGRGDLVSYDIIEGTVVICDYAFRDCIGLVSITIPDSVTSIGRNAFSNGNALYGPTLEAIEVYESNKKFKSVSGVLFDKYMKTIICCPEKKVLEKNTFTIPSSVTSIAEYAFKDCWNLESIIIPDSVTSIGEYAFRNCRYLTSIIIPDSVTSIGEGAFLGCHDWKSIEVNESNKHFKSVGGILFNKSLKTIICCPLQKVFENNTFTIPSSVTSIGASAFRSCYRLESIIIPDSVTSIGASAFNSSNLKRITIPNSVTSIGESAFRGCPNLESITVPDSVTSIGESAFSGCSNLKSIIISDSVTSIGASAFESCRKLQSITIPDYVTSIGENAFLHCSLLEAIEVSESNKNFKSFSGVLFDKYMKTIICCPEKKVLKKNTFTIPSSVTSIGAYSFYNRWNLESIIIPDSVTSIGAYAFFFCKKIKSITIPDSVTSIGESAFEGCWELKSITIPDSVIKPILWHCDSKNLITNELQDFIKKFLPDCANMSQIIIISSDVLSETKQIWFELERRTIEILIKTQK